MPRAARTDANHAAIVKALRQCGARVLDLCRVGHGCPDILIYVGMRLFLLEIKTLKGELSPDQERFHCEWPVIVIRDVEAVPKLVTDLRRLQAQPTAQTRGDA